MAEVTARNNLLKFRCLNYSPKQCYEEEVYIAMKAHKRRVALFVPVVTDGFLE